MYMLSQPIKCIHIGMEMYGNFYKAVINLQIDLLCVRHSAIMLQVLHFQGVATICWYFGRGTLVTVDAMQVVRKAL